MNEFYYIPNAKLTNVSETINGKSLEDAIKTCVDNKSYVAFRYNIYTKRADFSTKIAFEKSEGEGSTVYMKKSEVDKMDKMRNQINDKVREIYKEPGTLSANYAESFDQTTLAATMVGLLGVTLVIYLIRQS